MAYRSGQWFTGDDEVAVLHRVAMRLSPADSGRPVIGIADTSSALNPCQGAFARIMPNLEQGIVEAGGVPARFPVMSLGEDLMKPSAMLYRNLVAMELEENARSYPLDGVVFLANCDKTVPAALMAAATIELPSLVLLGGSRAAPELWGRRIGSGTGVWRLLDRRRAGKLDDREWAEMEQALGCAGPGSCNTMGTASTMALLTESLGMALPGSTGVSAAGAELAELAYRTGQAIVRQTRVGEEPRQRMTQSALDNAYRILAASGGSTNAVIHLAAIAGRLGLDCDLHRVDRLWRTIPLLVDVEPSGAGLIHDFAAAGGYLSLGSRMIAAGLLDPDVRTATGESLGSVAHSDPPEAHDVIRGVDDPVTAGPALAAVFGTLAPDGAILKVSAASPALLRHTGRAVVFDGYHEMRRRLDDPSLDWSPDDVLVIRDCGPVGVPGMPEWGMAPIPRPLAAAGVTDMVRISDGRMSGTSFGTVALHVAPEAAIGGPLALVADGDLIELDVPAGRLELVVDENELAHRRSRWRPNQREHVRGWPAHYQDHVLQAPAGCDLDYLTAPTDRARSFVEPVVGRS